MHIVPDKGSSWLHEVLIRHQQIFMPEAKDLYFFDRYYDRGLSWYLGQFSGARPRTSWSARSVRTTCSTWRRHAASRSRWTTYGSCRRHDPADRAFSSYLYMQHGIGPNTFLEAPTRVPSCLSMGVMPRT